MSVVAEWILDNKDSIEKGMKILSQGCEVLAVTVGQFNPILEAVFRVTAELLGNPEDKEAKYLAEQFESVSRNLEKIQSEIKNTELALQRSSLNIENFMVHAQIINQYEMFKYIYTAKPKQKKLKIEEFIDYFEEYEGDKNLEVLYGAIMKENASGDKMLDTILKTEQRNRRAVEEFCASMKKVFVMGIVALMAYAALTEGTVGEDLVKKWQNRMVDLETCMKAAVDECVNKFTEQAKIDLNQKLMERQSSVDPEFTKFLLKELDEKYYWVSWSVRVFKDDDCKFWSFFCGKVQYVSGGGDNYFEILCSNKIRIVVSFTTNPKLFDKDQIKDLIGQETNKIDLVATFLCQSLPNCHVHVVRRTIKVEEANNFKPEHFYFISHKVAHICIHSK